MTDVPDTGTIEASAPPDEVWQIQVEHSSYYQWLPIKEDEVTEGMVTVDSYWPGFRMHRTVVYEPTTTRTTVHVPSLKAINDDRKAAGMLPRSDLANLVQHLGDGAWPKHFPPGSITKIRCDDAVVQRVLIDNFIGGGS
jgi:hypothetical protein